jgi:hypothetical protein
MDNVNLQRLDRCLQTMIGPNQPLCAVYTYEDVFNRLCACRKGDSTQSYLELDGLITDSAAEKLQRGKFSLNVITSKNATPKTVVSW